MGYNRKDRQEDINTDTGTYPDSKLDAGGEWKGASRRRNHVS